MSDTEKHEESNNPCPICLGSFVQESYLDQCFHKFCYKCILCWRKVVGGKSFRLASSLKCPLCKTENFSIIHGYDGSSFQRHYFNQDCEDSFTLSKAHKYRLQCYYTKEVNLNDVFNVSRYWKTRGHLRPNRWLHDWLKREIQALIQEEDVDIIMHHISGMIDSLHRFKEKDHTITPESKQMEFETSVSDAARPFLAARTSRFVKELQLFLASGLSIKACDEVYMQQMGWNNPVEIDDGTDRDFGTSSPLVPYLYIFDDDDDTTD